MDFDQDKGDYNAQDAQENQVLNDSIVSLSPTASVHIKTEKPPQEDALNILKFSVIKEEQRKCEDHHVDHSYINDTSPMKFNQVLSPKVSHSSVTLQEIKVRPQFIKEEAIPEDELCIKTETNGDPIKTPMYKCSTCNLPFRNKYVFKKHRGYCHTGVSSKTFSDNVIKQMNFKYRPRKYNTLMMKKLISCVKDNPCLYDLDHENFNNADLKSVIWSNIASECNFPNGMIANTQWKALKNQFIKTITQQNMPNPSKSNSSNWQYEKQMEFVMPYITDRDVHINLNKESNNTNTEESTNVNDEVVEEEGNFSNNLQQHTQRLKRASVSSTQPETFIKRKRDDETPSTSQSQPLDMFFLSMCATTKNLPEYVQLQVKKKIFQAVIEAEEIVAAMHNDQEKNNLMNNEFDNNMSPFSVHSNVNEVWDDN